MGIVKFDDSSAPNVTRNPLPNHANQRVNGINESGSKKIKCEVAEVKTPLRRVWKEMIKRGLIVLDSKERSERKRYYCEFHNGEVHEIQECIKFRALVQDMMDNKEVEFYEELKSPEEGNICSSEGESIVKTQKVNYPVNYGCNVTIPREENPVNASEEGKDIGLYTCSRRRYNSANARVEHIKGKALVVEQMKEKTAELEPPVNKPVNEEEAKEFLKILKYGEYSIVEQLYKKLARISMLALLLSLEVHRSSLMKVLNETYVTNDISINKLDCLVSNISTDNFIFFNDDEIPPEGMGSTKALYINTRCKGYTLPGVLIDNGLALNVLPLSMLNRLPVDSSYMKTCQNIMKAFNGTERRVMERIKIPLLIGPNTYDVDFLVVGIKPSYNCLLGRP
ncbi:uncharacterized protein LOC108471836 [Gossypium arboreum]|uniref:uncharacterized protein LOC108471836 n=1 Tax=Gossypium arboreum TaxID=29729 RepID=UPI000819423C|nr:uncharacterized protein LOC108471836 [Gossypium arboreum]